MTAPLGFFAAEVEVVRPGSGSGALSLVWGSTPWGALSRSPVITEETGQILASDVGYRTLASDPSGVVPYPPLLSQAFQIDREINLDPTSAGASYGWGAMLLSNQDGRYDNLDEIWNVNRRAVRVYHGAKTFDPGRGIWTDPSYGDLDLAFAGLAGDWFLSATDLQIPLRDASYWLDAPVQSTLYLGTGAYEGTASLTGVPKPKARGGSSTNPIRNVTPVLIDPVNLIYQYTDGPGTVVALYEGAATTITFASNTTNLYSGSTPAGQFRTDNSRGLFQLGSAPAAGYAITCDVTGAFPTAGAQTNLLTIARYLLTEDCSFPTANLDTASFTALGIAYPYVAGVWFGPEATTASVAIAQLLSSLYARLVPRRDGTCKAIALRAPTGSETLVAALDPTNIVSLVPQPLPDAVSPAPYRFRVGYQHNNTVQTSGINTASASAAQQQFVAAEDRYASWSSADVLAAYAKPNDPAPVTGALLVSTSAQAVANALGALWGTRRRLFEVEVPLDVGLAVDLGDYLAVTYPSGDLRSGRVGLVVGDRLTSAGATMTLRILI